MSTERASSIKEQYMTRGLFTVIPSVLLIGFGAMFMYYNPLWTALGWVMIGIGAIIGGYGVMQFVKAGRVSSVQIRCPFCGNANSFVEHPYDPVRCEGCQRQIPIVEGQVLRVAEVRCGFCNAINFYSEKSIGLLCEQCEREIPISVDDSVFASRTMQEYSRQDDMGTYDLVLIDGGTKQQEVIEVLQQMLALNRNQVKQILDETPTTLLQGIPKKKAELLSQQLISHGARAEYRATEKV